MNFVFIITKVCKKIIASIPIKIKYSNRNRKFTKKKNLFLTKQNTMKINLKLIKEARLKKDYRQDDVAEFLGVSQSQYSKLENGEIDIKVEQIAILLEKLDLNHSDIITFSNHIPNFSNPKIL